MYYVIEQDPHNNNSVVGIHDDIQSAYEQVNDLYNEYCNYVVTKAL